MAASVSPRKHIDWALQVQLMGDITYVQELPTACFVNRCISSAAVSVIIFFKLVSSTLRLFLIIRNQFTIFTWHLTFKTLCRVSSHFCISFFFSWHREQRKKCLSSRTWCSHIYIRFEFTVLKPQHAVRFFQVKFETWSDLVVFECVF